MKVLLDEDLPHRLRLHIVNHDVFTVSFAGWTGLKNGELLGAAEQDSYDVFITGDKNLSYQQNLTDRRIAVVVLSTQKFNEILPHLQAIADAIDKASPGSFQFVACHTVSDEGT